MTDLERAREARAAQGLRVANASRSHKPRELEAYLLFDRVVRRLESESRVNPGSLGEGEAR